MSPLAALACVILLLAATTSLGLVWQRQRGRVRDAPAGDYVEAATLGIELGERATLLQFSSRYCAPCTPTRLKLSRLASEHPGVRHHDIDLSEDLATAQRYKIMQTPTVLVLDLRGRVMHRIGGPPRLADLSDLLSNLGSNPSTTGEKRAHAA